jgi:hypothetical protein
MLLLLVVVVCLAFGISTLVGAPYLPIMKRDSELVLKLAELKQGNTLIDLGSGDGRLLKAAARQGIICIGYEINPILYVISLIVTWPERKLITIYMADYWSVKLPDADVIYVFLLQKYMSRLSRKLHSEAQPDTLLISYIFKIPGAKPIRENRNTSVYRIGELEEIHTKS